MEVETMGEDFHEKGCRRRSAQNSKKLQYLMARPLPLPLPNKTPSITFQMEQRERMLIKIKWSTVSNPAAKSSKLRF